MSDINTDTPTTPKSPKKSASKKATKEKTVSFFKQDNEASATPEGQQDQTLAQRLDKLASQLSALETKLDGFIEEYRENQNKVFQNRPQHSGPRPFRPEGRPFRQDGGNRPFREGRPFRQDGGNRPYNQGPRRAFGQGGFGNRDGRDNRGGGGHFRPGPRRPFNDYGNRDNRGGGDFRPGQQREHRNFPSQEQQD
ncbi:MAG: hypothetical protein MOGMAGMI_02138 [Candidatus Omnitrophica bacterium]|nr:hypothetical protein [Candidatus Omnitrophota bacterium]